MEYLQYYELKEDPFKLTPDPEFFFPSESHNLALKALDYSTESAEGFALITGEPGTGKTTLIKVFCTKWQHKADIALILTPSLNPEEFLQAVLDELNISIIGAHKNELLKAFRDILLQRAQEGKKVIIIVDEAQNLPVETLEELRTLSNLETEKEKLLQIILVGQQELRRKLKTERLRQLDQRIYTRVDLGYLTLTETKEYINYRLIKAGRTFLRFDEGAIKLIYEKTAGVPRQINILAQRALMSGYIDDSKIISKHHVKTAFESINIEFKQTSSAVKVSNIVLGTLIGLVILAIVFYFYLKKELLLPYPFQNTTEASLSATTRVKISSNKPKVEYIVVSSWEANLRTAPSLKASKIGTVVKGIILEVLNKKRDSAGRLWYQVKVFKNKKAWIAASTVVPLKESVEP